MKPSNLFSPKSENKPDIEMRKSDDKRKMNEPVNKNLEDMINKHKKLIKSLQE
jgi:hypothetical protein